jgi:hypothetical protein
MGIITLDFFEMIEFKFEESIPKVSSSISEKMGFAPTISGQFAVEIKVKEGIMTSLDGLRFRESKAACPAEVPELKVTQYLDSW